MIVHVKFLAFALCTATALAAPADENCDKSKCKGPLRYYEELECEPIYKKSGDCCPSKFNCGHLKSRAKDKCYFNGHEYNVGDGLRDEDRLPCDISCYCRDYDGLAEFSCAVVDCFAPFQENCYNPSNATDCCPGQPICTPKEQWPTCEVDGKTYEAGQRFVPADEPNKECYCGEGYEGENVAPFCRTMTKFECGIQLRHSTEARTNCAPVYYNSQSPQTDCVVAYRCQNDKDEVVKKPDSSESKSSESSEEESKDACTFGNLEMRLGDELNQSTDYSSVCVKCVCEVPPVPTCQRLPDAECDVTNHPPFSHVQ